MQEEHYRYTREEVVSMLHEWRGGSDVPVCIVADFLMEPATTQKETIWAYQASRKHGFVGMELPCDPQYAQILALDT